VQHEFVTGNLALDYVATVAERGTTRLEHLAAPDDLAEWIAQAGIVDGPVAVTPAGLERAKVVREALFALVEATIDGESAPREPLRVVNEAAAAPPPTPALQDASPGPRSSCSAAPSGRGSSGAPARTARARSSTAHVAAGGAGAGWPAAATARRRPPTALANASAPASRSARRR
jgi:hypothetical protein